MRKPDSGVITRKAERIIRRELKKYHGIPFTITTNETNRAVKVVWYGGPSRATIEAIGAPLKSGVDGDGIWFFHPDRM
jgi:hypothetical protein